MVEETGVPDSDALKDTQRDLIIRRRNAIIQELESGAGSVLQTATTPYFSPTN